MIICIHTEPLTDPFSLPHPLQLDPIGADLPLSFPPFLPHDHTHTHTHTQSLLPPPEAFTLSRLGYPHQTLSPSLPSRSPHTLSPFSLHSHHHLKPPPLSGSRPILSGFAHSPQKLERSYDVHTFLSISLEWLHNTGNDTRTNDLALHIHPGLIPLPPSAPHTHTHTSSQLESLPFSSPLALQLPPTPLTTKDPVNSSYHHIPVPSFKSRHCNPHPHPTPTRTLALVFTQPVCP